MGSSKGLTYRLAFTKVSALGPAVPSPAPAGVSYLSCSSTSFCAAAPSLNQVALYNGTSWGAPTTIAAAQGFTAVDCTGPSFCITIDGEGNSFALRGGELERQPRGLGGGQPDLLRLPDLLRGRRGRALGLERQPCGPSRATPTARVSSMRSPAPRPPSACWSTAAAPS